MGYNVQLSDEAKEFIADKGFDSKFGARPLQRAMQKYLEDPLAEEILKGEIVEGSNVMVEYDKENDNLKVQTGNSKKSKKTKG